VQQHTKVLRELVHRPVQTNEVGRCAALLGGFLEVVRRTGFPLRLLEVGAAGGLILRWDLYRYEGRDESWGDPDSPVRIRGAFPGANPPFDTRVKITDRRGCDASPVDPCTEEGQLTLQAYVWPDQVERFRLLTSAIEVAREVPVRVDRANAVEWVEDALASNVSGAATVVYHSIVWPYLSNPERARFKRVMAEARRAATANNPLAWLRMEPADNVAEVRLQLWPGGEDQLLARSGFHGRPVEWLGGEN